MVYYSCVALVNAGVNVYQNWDAIKSAHGREAVGVLLDLQQ